MAGLDIAALSKRIVGVGMVLAGTAKVTATLHLGKSQEYDFDTDKMTSSGGSDPTVKGLLYRSKQTQGVDLSTRQAMFFVEGKDAPSGMTEADTLTIGSDKWNIDEVEPLAGNSAYIIHLRR